MSEQKVVFNKLFKKEELASQKVELALVDDIKKNIDNTFKFGSELEVLYNVELKNIKEKILKEYNSLLAEVPKVDKDYQDLRRKSLELGLEVPSNLVQLYTEMLKMTKEERDRISKVKSL